MGRVIHGYGRLGIAALLSVSFLLLIAACTGDSGATGPQGASGSPGAAGPQGAIGPEGSAGAAGPQGDQGPSGPQGAAGPAGAQGSVGPAGPQGVQGLEGPRGQGDKPIAMVVQFGDPAFGDSRNRNLLPSEFEVSTGDTIRFVVAGFHQIAVHNVDAGTTRQDVIDNRDAFLDTTINDPVVDFAIGDPTGRIALGPSFWSVDSAVVNRDDSLGQDVNFAAAGRYLVICAIRSHFFDDDPAANGGMFGLVTVAEQLEGQGDASLTAQVGLPADLTVRFGDPRFRERGDLRNRILLPSDVAVDAGQTIRFDVAGFHQVAVYQVDPETTRKDVNENPDAFLDTSINDLLFGEDIGDTAGRIFIGPSPRAIDASVVNRDDSLGANVTITEPGRYLVICAIRSHFLGGLFGFVNVN